MNCPHCGCELVEDLDEEVDSLECRLDVFGRHVPGFQFMDHHGRLHPTVTALFGHALELRIPHNYFAVWMVTLAGFGGARRVDSPHRAQELHRALEGFAAQLRICVSAR